MKDLRHIYNCRTASIISSLKIAVVMIPVTEFLIFAATFLLSVIVYRSRNGKTDKRRYPPAFPRLPIIGSLPFVPDLADLPEFLTKKISDLGPVFRIHIGSRYIVILNTLEAIEDAFVKQASSFSGRDGLYVETNLLNPQRKGIIFKQYDAEFTKYRRLTLSVMREFGFGSKSKSEEFVLTEVSELIDHVKKMNGKAFDPREVIAFSASNVPVKMVFGRRRTFEEGFSEAVLLVRRFVETIEPAIEFFPFLKIFPYYRNKMNKQIELNAKIMEKMQKEFEAIMQDGTSDCFVKRYIKKEGPDYDHEQLIYTLRDIFEASVDTTSTVLMWSLLFIANHPKVAERIRKEIDSVLPRDRLPTSDDQSNMPLIEATILEILRLTSIIPFAVPHMTLHDTEVLGFFVPENITIFPNIRSAHRNHIDWPDGDLFRPERFLDENNKVINKNRVIPFSLGRRACPGEALARHQLFLFIAGLVQNFSFLPPDGMKSIPMETVHGTVEAPSPYKIRMVPR